MVLPVVVDQWVGVVPGIRMQEPGDDDHMTAGLESLLDGRGVVSRVLLVLAGVALGGTLGGCSLAQRVVARPEPETHLSLAQASASLERSLGEAVRTIIAAPEDKDVSGQVVRSQTPASCTGRDQQASRGLAEEVRASVGSSEWDRDVYRVHQQVGILLARWGYIELGADVSDDTFGYHWTTDDVGDSYTISLRIDADRQISLSGRSPCLPAASTPAG